MIGEQDHQDDEDDVDGDELDEAKAGSEGDLDGGEVGDGKLEEGNDLDDEATNATRFERLCSVDGWEMYRMIGEDTALVVASVALRPSESDDELESGEQATSYAVWRPSDLEDPLATGAMTRRARRWDDAEREGVLRQVVRLHHEVLQVDPEKIMSLRPELQDEHPESEGQR